MIHTKGMIFSFAALQNSGLDPVPTSCLVGFYRVALDEMSKSALLQSWLSIATLLNCVHECPERGWIIAFRRQATYDRLLDICIKANLALLIRVCFVVCAIFGAAAILLLIAALLLWSRHLLVWAVICIGGAVLEWIVAFIAIAIDEDTD